MPKFNKSDGFQLRSGNNISRTSFFKGEARVTPPQGTGGIYYKAPLKETVDQDNNKEEETEETTVETTTNDPKVNNDNEEKKKEKEKEEEAEAEEQDTGIVNDGEKDTFWQKAGKILGQALISGHDAVYGTKTKKLPPVEWRDKVKTEVEAGDTEDKVDKMLDHSKGEIGPKTEEQVRQETLEQEKNKNAQLADKNNNNLPDYMEIDPEDNKVDVKINNANQQGPNNEDDQLNQ